MAKLAKPHPFLANALDHKVEKNHNFLLPYMEFVLKPVLLVYADSKINGLSKIILASASYWWRYGGAEDWH